MTAGPWTICEVPHCRHRTRVAAGPWVCGEHWRMTDRRARRVFARVLRRVDAAFAPAVRITPWQDSTGPIYGRWSTSVAGELIGFLHPDQEREAERADAAFHRLWARLRRQAIERGLGIAA